MIQINDNDLPITVAEKIITGVKPNNPTPFMKALAKSVTGNENISDMQDIELKKLREQQTCEDCISRQAVLDQINFWSKDELLKVTNPFYYLHKRIESLPSVTPKTKIE